MNINVYLRNLRTMMDSQLTSSVEEALNLLKVPAELRARIIELYEEEIQVPIRPVSMLTGRSLPGEWYKSWDPASGYYWKLEREYLIDKQLKSDAVRMIDDSTNSILSRLYDPRAGGQPEFDLRGLVMGHVQSGKTANYCALIAKAADLGYKFVIVLSGIHNSLRLQTQRRVDRALGNVSDGAQRPAPGYRWIDLTHPNLSGDFNPGSIDANVLQGNDRVVMVCKKISPILRRINIWLDNNPPPDTLPVLIIDDEADLASINTGGNRPPPLEEQTDLTAEDTSDVSAPDEVLDPSVINFQIRKLVRSFNRVCYIAYTATPFANILINHLALDREVFQDLYPKDFIVSLPTPRGYCGAEMMFGHTALRGDEEDSVGMRELIKIVGEEDAKKLTPRGADLQNYEGEIVQSLKDAFYDFILATGARLQRSGKDIPSTMLVHTHQRKIVQNRLGSALREFIDETRDSWRYDKPSIFPYFQDRWEKHFRPVIVSYNQVQDVPFEKVAPYVDSLFHDPVPLIVLNSDSNDELDYDKDPTLKAIVVGGNRLSRGLTLEGLTVSYYVRETDQYDTLMQMGRWFGYREGYVDLTRLYTTSSLFEWFQHLTLAEEELRLEIARYEIEKLTPLDFGAKIRTHNTMMVTARNKLGSARLIYQNYEGSMFQTTFFLLDDLSWLLDNLNAGVDLVRNLENLPLDNSYGLTPVWRNVPWQIIDSFLEKYRLYPRGIGDMGAIRQYIKRQADQEELVRWTVAIRGLNKENLKDGLGTEPALSFGNIKINRIGRALKGSISPNETVTLITPAQASKDYYSGDEEIGLTHSQIDAARKMKENDTRLSYSHLLRKQRSKEEGLLLLYPVSPNSRPSGKGRPLFEHPEGKPTVLGIAISFPASGSAATIEYIIGSVGG